MIREIREIRAKNFPLDNPTRSSYEQKSKTQGKDFPIL
jgi:hypothetical protein